MKRFAIVMMLVLFAAGAQAQSVYDMRTDLVAEDSPVQVQNLVVTGAYYNGCFVSEAPYDEYRSIWIYMGSGAPEYPVAGDVIMVEGVFKIYNGLYEIDISAGQWALQGTMDLPAPIELDPAVVGDPAAAAPYMCSLVYIPGQLTFTADAGFGEWFCETDDGVQVMFDNFWHEMPPVEEIGACFESATGCLNWSYGNFKVAAFEDGMPVCTVDTEDSSFGSVKSLYR